MLFAPSSAAVADADKPRLDRADYTHVAVVKLRDFESLRAEMGFDAASLVLESLAARLIEAVGGGQVLRIGRTTLEVALKADAADLLTEQLTRARALMQRPVVVDGLEMALAVACGAAPLDPTRPLSESIDRASGALIQALANRSFVVVSQGGERRADTMGDVEVARALRTALANDALELHYQPKLHCRDDSIRSAEALLRWTDGELGSMPIDRVVAAAERTGAIRSLTDWVVDRALRDAAALAAAGRAVTIFVNLSGRLLADGEYIAALIARVAGRRIGIEITETAVIDDPADAIANLAAMTAAGMKVAIDDYGSGLSSLAYLKQLPAHELKIDRLFIKDLTTSHRDPLLVRSSIDLAHALEMEVTAEGVDDAMTLSLLRIMGCDIIQGYLISRPLPLDALVAFLAAAEGLRGVGRAVHSLPEIASS